MTGVALQPENEPQARELREAAKTVETLDPEKVVAVVKYLKTVAGTNKPSASQVKAAAEVAAATGTHGGWLTKRPGQSPA
ncbi:hypothetical protein [Deinococcus hopiensis]|uniref:Uncharacterized protein n=1 Tax=Deinococcus hopiensis KR-140 TaxID=695939 RepID=A0A1W1UU15_9DEIO|nr:hypothetical protein [Deinococcus hopiensis]SMB84540.1 hypothetical protein SAMN00790413_05183 [Deinococcus hopiensis KR-140]